MIMEYFVVIFVVAIRTVAMQSTVDFATSNPDSATLQQIMDTVIRLQSKLDEANAKIADLQDESREANAKIADLESASQAQSTAFHAWYYCSDSSSSSLTPCTLSQGATIIYNRVELSAGGHYSSSSGEFTCPYRGFYHFTVSVRTESGQRAEVGFRRRAAAGGAVSDFSRAYADDISGAHNSAHASATAQCDAGDTVFVFVSSESIVSNGYANYFSGFLLYRL